jgi:hypothetical protein
MLDELQKVLAKNQKIQVTVWDPDDDTMEYTFPSFVMNRVGALFMVAAPTVHPQKIIPLLQKDVTVGAVLETYPNPFIFYPVVHSLPEDGKSGYWLRIPENTPVEVIQRRKHVRIPMVVPLEVEYQLAGLPDKLKIAARTEDVSGGGLRFNSVTLFPVGQEVMLHIQLNPSIPMLHLKAKVVVSMQNRLRKQADDMYTTACQFIELDDAREMVIVRECFRRELKLKQ